jgi:hypothetical protein
MRRASRVLVARVAARRTTPALATALATTVASALAVAAPAAVHTLGAQTWRTVSAARQAHGADSLHVRVRYGVALWAGRKGRKGEMRLLLAPAMPLDLDLDLGAAEADLDLTGLTVERLRVSSGATETRVRFGAPNPVPLRELSITSGAADVRVEGLGDANADRVRVKCAVGSVALDLGGSWPRDMDLTLDVAVGGTTIRVPRGVGVRVRLDKVLASFDSDGLTRRGDSYYSAGYDAAPRKVTVDARTVLGSFEVHWLDR